MKRFAFVFAILALISASFAVPRIFSYQGKLTNTSGVGINDDVDIIVRLYDDSLSGTLLCADTLINVPVIKGLFDIKYKARLTHEQLGRNLFMELIIDGNVLTPRLQITAVPYALTALYQVDTTLFSFQARRADSLGGYVAEDFLQSLNDAYAIGETIYAYGLPVDIRTELFGPADGRAMEIRSFDNMEPTLYVYNMGAGPAIFCSGDFQINGNKKFLSDADLKFQLDADADGDALFIVQNDASVTVMSIDENGDMFVLGEIDPKAVVFIPQTTAPTPVRGKVYYDDADNRLKVFDGTAWVDIGSGGGTTIDTTKFIWNQTATNQDAGFWVNGPAVIGPPPGGGPFWTETFSAGGAGWTIEGEWQINAAVGGNVSGYTDRADPTTDRTPTGDNMLLGYDVTGLGTYLRGYENNMATTMWATSPIIDCSERTNVSLSFWRWLGVENNSWDNAYIQVWDGTTWVTIWQNGAITINEATWTQYTYDVSAYADGNPSFMFRFGMGPTDGSVVYQGWSIDDIALSEPFFDEPVTINNSDVSAGSFTLDGVTWNEWPSLISKLDTLWAGERGVLRDTIYALDNFYINGELIADSIQARADTIFLDDHIKVDGCGLFGGGTAPSVIVLDEQFTGTTFPPTGWTANILSGGYNWTRTTLYFTSSPASARHYVPSYTPSQAELITPPMDLTGAGAFLSFRHCQEAWGSDQDSLHVYYRISATDPWILLARWNYSIPRTAWASELLNLPSPSASYFIRFCSFGCYGYGVYIDDVRVGVYTGAAPPGVTICAGNVNADGNISVSGNLNVAQNITVSGGLNDGASFGTSGQVLTADGAGNFAWQTPPAFPAIVFDSLWAKTRPYVRDTVRVLDNLYVNGALIADSIQAVGHTLRVDDSLWVLGNARIQNNIRAGGNVTATNVLATDNITANNSMTLNGVTITAWPSGGPGTTGSLDMAYDYLAPGGGRIIMVDAGPVFLNAIDMLPADTALLVINSSFDPAGVFINYGTGDALQAINAGGGLSINAIGDASFQNHLVVGGNLVVDTIVNVDGDTLWILDKIATPELVTDTIESKGSVVAIKDALSIRDSLWFDGAWRKTWTAPITFDSTKYIWNQYTGVQDASFWIRNKGTVGGVTSYSDVDLAIGAGTLTSTLAPLAGWYRWVRNVSLITASEIGAPSPCTIDTLSIFLGSPSATNPWTYDSVYIWLQNTTSATAPTTWDVSGATQVFYAAALPVPQVAGWYHFDISDFTYNGGTNNLLIWFQHGYQFTNYASGGPAWRYTTQATSTLHSQRYVDSGGWPTTLTASTSRPNFRLSIQGLATIIDKVHIENGIVNADNDLLIGGTSLKNNTGAGVIGYNNAISGLTSTKVQGAIDELDTRLDGLGTAGNYIQNQYITSQSAQMWIQNEAGFGSFATYPPLTQGFNDSLPFPATGWTVRYANPSPPAGNLMRHTASFFYEGARSFRFSSYSSGSPYDQYLITPQVNATAGDRTVSFWYRRFTSGSEIFRVGWSTTDTALASFTWSSDITGATTTWQQYIKTDLPIGTKYICIHYKSVYQYYLYIDQFVGPATVTPVFVPGVLINNNNVRIMGGLNDGVSFGTSGQVLTADGANNFSWRDLPLVVFDTLWAKTKPYVGDTVCVLDNLYVNGELIADSIQAVSHTIRMDDTIWVRGNAKVDIGINMLSGVPAGASTYRTDWEPQQVITVGLSNADFDNIHTAVAAAGAIPTLIDIAPGNYLVPSGFVIPSNVFLRGSGIGKTIVLGRLTIMSEVSRIKFIDSTVVFNNGNADYCEFTGNVIAQLGTGFNHCIFRGGPMNTLTLGGKGYLSNCDVNFTTTCTGDYRVDNNDFTANFNVNDPLGRVHFVGNTFHSGGIILSNGMAYIEANKFKSGPVGIRVDDGRAEIKANHFLYCPMGAITVNGGRADILSNDIISCGDRINHPSIAGNLTMGGAAFEINIIGNHIDGMGEGILAGIALAGGIGTEGPCYGLIKDNVIERCNTGVVVSGMNLTMTTILRMSIDNNVIYRNANVGLSIGTGNYLVVHNNLYGNGTLDMSLAGGNVVVSHNVVDFYNTTINPVPGALNTNSSGLIWAGAPQIGQLP